MLAKNASLFLRADDFLDHEMLSEAKA